MVGGNTFNANLFVYFTMANKIQEQENTEECYINTIFGLKKKSQTIVPVEHNLHFSGIKPGSIYTFWFSISHHQFVCKKTERYKFTTVIVVAQGSEHGQKIFNFLSPYA